MRAVVNLPAAATARGAFAYALGLKKRRELNFAKARAGAVGVVMGHQKILSCTPPLALRSLAIALTNFVPVVGCNPWQ